LRVRRNLEVIRTGLADVWTTQGRRFVTFEVEDGEEDDRWVQYLDGELNLSWPFEEDLPTALARRAVALPAGAFCGWSAPGENAVIEVGDAKLDDVAVLVEALFDRVLAERKPFRVGAKVLDHA
jgi:hypothetical protein